MSSSHYSEVSKLPAFQERVVHYLADACIDVLVGEAETPDSQEDSQVRFAQRFFQGRISMDHVCQAVVSNDSVRTTIGTNDATTANAAITDNDLSYVVKTEQFAGLALSV